MNKDLDQLRLLSIFHYVLAGLCIFPLLYGVFYMVIGIFAGAMIASAPNNKDGGPPAVLFGGIFVFIGLFIVIVSLTIGFLIFKSGRNLSKQTGYTFCFVIACISCVFMPFGTILGIFTIIVLSRDTVKALFNGQNVSNYNPQSWQQ
ncbi:MAG TPA: hypothetical protein PKY82_32795 [Pyrinomonadaceae bacterium]|nr:hypothetical protein [Pyrinomonadaceae bacterium]